MFQPDTMLLDYNNLMLRMTSVYNLYYGDKYTGSVYGLLVYLSKLILNFRPEQIIAVNDGYPLKRSKVYREYKQDRNRTIFKEDVIKHSKSYTKQLLELMAIPLVSQVGYESDDIMGYFVEKYKEKSFLLVSNDSDLDRFVSDRVMIYKQTGLFSIEDFKEKYCGLDPSELEPMLAFIGTHNNISPLVKGIGMKRYLKLSQMEREKYISLNKERYEENLRLVRIPYDDGISIEVPMLGFRRRHLENWLIRDLGIRLTKNIENCFDFLAEKFAGAENGSV